MLLLDMRILSAGWGRICNSVMCKISNLENQSNVYLPTNKGKKEISRYEKYPIRYKRIVNAYYCYEFLFLVGIIYSNSHVKITFLREITY